MAGREDLAPKGLDILTRDVSLDEIQSLFDITTGHDHDGTNSATVSWNNIADKPSGLYYSLTAPTNEFTSSDDGVGNLTLSWKTQSAGLVLASPSASSGTPSFRSLVSSDIPALSYEPVLTKGNLTESTSSVLTISGGTGSIIGSGTTIQVKQASSTVSGYLSSTDWSTFNGKMDATASTTAGYVPVWGANGKTLGTGYSIETTMTGSSSALVRADAVKTYIDGVIATADALVYKGVINCSTNPNYPAGDNGHVYKVSVAGKIGGASGITVEVGDMVICNTDSTASGTQATVGSKWDIIQNNDDLTYVEYLMMEGDPA